MKWSAVAAFLAGMSFGVRVLHAAPKQLWPTFSEPSTIVNVQIAGNNQSTGDLLAESTLQGAYNQLQGSTRLYLSVWEDDPYWIAHSIPSGITVTNMSYTTSDPDGALKALLTNYGSAIAGYIICDPVNQPESCNFGVTLAGIRDAVVVTVDNYNNVIAPYFPAMHEVADLTTYLWVGDNNNLVNNGSDVGATNMINNPSGGGGTTGWTASTGTVSTATAPCGGSTLKWVRASGPGDAWAWFPPAIPDSRRNTTPYIFSVQVCGTGQVFLDAWTGAHDMKSSPVTLNGTTWQTLQVPAPIPLSGATGNTTIKLEVRSSQSTVTAYFRDAAVIDNRVAIDYFGYLNHLKQGHCNNTILAQNTQAIQYNLLDYEVAANMFAMGLRSDYSDEATLYGTIINYGQDPDTPIIGYVDKEPADVTFLSQSPQGHFLNAANTYNNGSVWASLPQPSALTQPAPIGVKAANGTVYLAFEGSDGDNVSYMQHRMQNSWTQNQFLGALPVGWTAAPGAIYYSPAMMSNYYQFLPQSDEIMGGPSGVGYTRAITGSDLNTFASLSNAFLTADDMSTTEIWANTEDDLTSFASDVGIPHVMWNEYLPYTPEGSTVLDGQAVGYKVTPPDDISAIEAVLNPNTGKDPYQGSGKPTFIEIVNDGWSSGPDDMLYVAQRLQLNSGYNFTFLTPTELALTEQAYVKGTGGSWPSTNAQTVAGSTLLTAYPQNLIYNANAHNPGQSIVSTDTNTMWALGTSGHDEWLVNSYYQGSNCEDLVVPGNSSNPDVFAFEGIDSSTAGKFYRFTASVAGSGTAYMTIYDGTTNHRSSSVTLTPAWQTITMVVKIQNSAAAEIQIGVIGSSAGQTLYFKSTPGYNIGWYYSGPSTSSASPVNFGGTTYNNGYFNTQTAFFTVPANQGISQWMNFYPNVTAGTTYIGSVDLAGTPGQQAYLDVYNGSTDVQSSTITLGSQWQTVNVSTMISGSSTPAFEVRVPNQSADTTVYFRNASLVQSGSGGAIDFSTGLESGQTQLTWTNTPDSASPGGGVSSVSGTLTQTSSTISRGGGYAIQYGGTASGGSSTHAYLEAFGNSTALTSTSRLSYWVYPMTPMGSESGASSISGLNSTCVALDVIFTDGTALRNISTITDQYGNRIHPSYQCNHLQPDQWNYVTVNLSGVSGKTVSRIDVGYDQPGATGTYGGYIDDIQVSH